MNKQTNTDKDFEYTIGMDIADSIALIVCMALVCLVFFI
jgi:hypothetical protein